VAGGGIALGSPESKPGSIRRYVGNQVQEMMRVVAAGYEKLARLAEQRVREADKV
jgi:hypothetical protein